MKLTIGYFRDGAVVRLENDRDLVRIAVLDVAIEAVIRDVELSVVEPLVERRTRFVERPREWLVPKDLVSCVLRPESGEILCGARVERVEIGLLDVGLPHNVASRRRCVGA